MVDIMPVVAAENAVPGKRRIAGLAEVGVLRAGIIPEDDVQGSLDVPGAIGALDDAALGDIGVALGVDAAACPWPARGELGFSVSSGMNSSAMKPVLS